MDASRLTKIRLFAGLSEAELRSIAVRAVEESVPAGTVLIREGDFAWDLIALVEGEVEVSSGERRLTTLGAGEIVGEIGCLGKSRRTATVTATTPVELVRLTHWDMHHMRRTAPTALDAIRALALERKPTAA